MDRLEKVLNILLKEKSVDEVKKILWRADNEKFVANKLVNDILNSNKYVLKANNAYYTVLSGAYSFIEDMKYAKVFTEESELRSTMIMLENAGIKTEKVRPIKLKFIKKV